MNTLIPFDGHLGTHLVTRLRAEHTRIGAVFEALDAFIDESIAANALDPHELIRFVTFIRGYVDGYHHELEESVFLPSLEEAGFGSLRAGPLAHIRHQHRDEELLVLKLEMAACVPAPWNAVHLALIADAVQELTSFERAHTHKENELLFPVAAKTLDDNADVLRVRLERFDQLRARRWNLPWLEALGIELVAARKNFALPAERHPPTTISPSSEWPRCQ